MSVPAHPDVDLHLPATLRLLAVLLRSPIERVGVVEIIEAAGCLDAPDDMPGGSTVMHPGASRPAVRLAQRESA